MKRKIVAGLVVVGIVITFFSIRMPWINMVIPDENLENAIRAQIGKSHGPLHESDLEKITLLSATNSDIKTIEGLEYCKNLKTLLLYGNNISDVTPLSNLANLTSLWLNEFETG